MNSGNCLCNPGWAGVSCDSECSEHGNITNGECECFYDDGWKGPLCDIPGCPGLNKLDCSGRGMFVLLFYFFMAIAVTNSLHIFYLKKIFQNIL